MDVYKIRLPPELWSSIIQQLSPRDQRTCLFVSRLHHDLSIRRLFSTVQIYFVPFDEVCWPGSDLAYDEQAELLTRSWELLDRISQDTQFAEVVKTIIVHAYADQNNPLIFEKLCLIKALRSLPRLRAFKFYGESRLLLPEVMEVLISSELKELRIPEHFHSSVSFNQLNGLKCLSYGALDSFTEAIVTPAGSFPNDAGIHIPGLVEANASTLRRLALPGRLILELPIRAFNYLTDIEFFRPKIFGNLELLFRHATCLESLAFVGLETLDLFPELSRSGSIAMPDLTSLKIISWVNDHNDSHYGAISEFLRGKLSLSRLDLDLPASWDVISTILPEIQSRIEVFGITVDHGFGEADQSFEAVFTGMARDLPSNLSAARVTFLTRTSFHGGLMSPLLEKFAQLPRLSFLDLYNGYHPLPIDAEEIVVDLKHLEILGLQRKLYHIHRTESGITLEPWSSRLAETVIEEHFACADEAWIMRYHLAL